MKTHRPLSQRVILILRVLLGIAVPILVLSEAVMDGPWGQDERRWSDIILPYLPLWGIAVGPRTGLAVWAISLVGLALTQAPVAAVASMVVPSIVTAAVCCYLLPRTAALWTAIAIIAAGILIPALFFENGIQAGGVLASMTALGAIGGLVLNMYRYRTAAQETEIVQLQEQHAQVRREERQRLGLELHDIVAHDVTVIAMQARRIRFIDDPQKVREVVERIGTTAQQTLQDLRSMVSLLREETAAEEISLGTSHIREETVSAGGMAEEVNRIQQSLENAGFQVNTNVSSDMNRIPSSMLPSLKRSIRELGTNILKHANPAFPVMFDLEVLDTEVVLCTSNTVSLTPPISSSGSGLAAMQTRSSVFGGTFDSAATGNIWTTRMALPLLRTSPEQDTD